MIVGGMMRINLFCLLSWDKHTIEIILDYFFNLDTMPNVVLFVLLLLLLLCLLPLLLLSLVFLAVCL